MPSYIIKPVAEEDFYVEYSTIVDAISSFGGKGRYAIDRVTRADETGTSALYGTGNEFSERSSKGLWFRTEWYPEIPEEADSGYIPWTKVRAFCDTFRDGEFHPTSDLVTDLTRYGEDEDDAFPMTWKAQS